MSQTVEQSEAVLAASKAACLDELKRDCERLDGSATQERRREGHQQSTRDAIAQCEREFEDAKRS